MNHNIKLIAIDIDGTLCDSEKQVSRENALAVKRAADAGIIMCLATGRPLYGLPEDVYKTEGFSYGIMSNGASTVDLRDNRILHQALIPNDRAVSIMEFLMSFPDTSPEIYIDGRSYIERERMEKNPQDFNITYSRRMKKTPVEDIIDFMRSDKRDIEKFYCLFKYAEDKEKVTERLMEDMDLNVVSSLKQNLEISNKDGNKGRALTDLICRLSISPEDVMAIGDSGNDLTMLNAVGYKVVMGNAYNDIKKIANEVTDTNDNNGVAKTLNRFLDELESLSINYRT